MRPSFEVARTIVNRAIDALPDDLKTAIAWRAVRAEALAARHVPYNYGGGHVTPAAPGPGSDGPFDPPLPRRQPVELLTAVEHQLERADADR